MSHQPVDKRGSTETDRPGLSLRESASSSSGGLSRAALHTLKAMLESRFQTAEHFDPEEAETDVEFHKGRRYELKRAIREVDALLTAPSSQQEENERHDDEQARGGTMGSPSDSLTASQHELIRALTGYVRHYPNCRQATHRLRACSCGLADLLTPASG